MIETVMACNSLQEQHKKLNKLISGAKSEEFTDELINSLKNKNRLDLVYLTGLANKFKNKLLVCELLKSEDGLIVSKVLKSDWFFDETTNGEIINVEYFTSNLFPYMSLSSKCKLITKLSIHLKDENIAQKFYEEIKNKYGINIAVKLLPVCSKEFIQEEFKNISYKIPYTQMRYIYDKHPDLVIARIEKIFADKGSYTIYEPIFNLMARDHPKSLQNIFNKHHERISIHFGYRSTIGLLKDNEKFIIESAENVYDNLHVRALTDTFDNATFDSFIKKLFPKDIYCFPEHVYKFIKQKKHNQSALYMITAYQLRYGKSILEENFLPTHFVESLPEEERIKYGNKKMKENRDDVEGIQYLRCAVAMDCNAELCKFASSAQRSKLSKKIIDCCRINKDNVALLKHMRFVAKRYRNEASSLNIEFLGHLQTSFKMHTLTSEHWDVIDEMITIQLINNAKCLNKDVVTKIFEEKLIYCLINGIEISSIVDTMAKHGLLNHFSMIIEKTDYNNKILDAILDKYKTLIQDKTLDETLVSIREVINLLIKWNEKYPKQNRSIVDYPWLVEQFKKIFEDSDTNFYSYDVINISKDKKALQIFAKDLFKINCCNCVLRYALKYDCTIIYDNITELIQKSKLPYSISDYIPAYEKIKIYFSEYLSKAIEENILKEVDTEMKVTEPKLECIGGLIVLLSFVKSVESYEDYIKKYFPSTTKINPTDTKSQQDYVIMKPVIKNLKHMNPPLSFDIVLQLAKDDYLKLVLPTLISLCYRKNEKESFDTINLLSDKPVSVKKHSVRLAYFIFHKNMIIPFYKKMWEGEKNSSVRDVIFQRTFGLLKLESHKNIIEEAWELIKHYFESFDEKDKNLFKYLYAFDDVPPEKISKFCVVAWEIIKKMESKNLKNVDIESVIRNFMYGITKHVELLDEEFCNLIINDFIKYLLKKSYVADAILDFCVAYVTKSESETIHVKRVNLVCEIFKNIIKNEWNKDLKKGQIRSSMESFVHSCCEKAIGESCKVNPEFLIERIYDMLISVLPMEAVFGLACYLKFALFYLESKKTLGITKKMMEDHESGNYHLMLKDFINKVVVDSENLVKKYGSHMFDIYTSKFESFSSSLPFNYYFHYHEHTSNVVKIILEQEALSQDWIILAINMLPSYINDDDENQVKMQKEITELVLLKGDITTKMILGSKVALDSKVFTSGNN